MLSGRFARWRLQCRDYAGGAALSVALHLFAALCIGLLLYTAPRPVPLGGPEPRVIMVVSMDGRKQKPPEPSAAASERPRPHAPQAATSPRRASAPAPRPAARELPAEQPPVEASQHASSTDPAAPTQPDTPTAASAESSAAAAVEVVEIPWAYLWSVKRAIAEHRRYPRKAYAQQQTGTPVVRIRLARDGTLLSATLLRTSGYPLLDAEARDVIFRIGHFAPLPERYIPSQKEFAIDQPIAFLLH